MKHWGLEEQADDVDDSVEHRDLDFGARWWRQHETTQKRCVENQNGLGKDRGTWGKLRAAEKAREMHETNKEHEWIIKLFFIYIRLNGFQGQFLWKNRLWTFAFNDSHVKTFFEHLLSKTFFIPPSSFFSFIYKFVTVFYSKMVSSQPS